MTLPQEQLIELVKDKCQNDDRLAAALTYGSFTKDEGDQYSDIEFWLFFDDRKLMDVDPVRWINEISPIYYSTINEYGTHVAFFQDHLIRGEFHFVAASEMDTVRSWPSVELPQSKRMVIIDRTGKLLSYILEGKPAGDKSAFDIEQLCGRFLNWYLFGLNVLKRGDLAQAHMLLGIIQGYLIWMARADEGSTKHWLTQSKAFEKEISEDAYKTFLECTARCEQQDLIRAYHEAWKWGCRLIDNLERKHNFSIPGDLRQAIANYDCLM
jgi:lincosamide nucleotidyltransferase B/F